jgi:hypothetical protein
MLVSGYITGAKIFTHAYSQYVVMNHYGVIDFLHLLWYIPLIVLIKIYHKGEGTMLLSLVLALLVCTFLAGWVFHLRSRLALKKDVIRALERDVQARADSYAIAEDEVRGLEEVIHLLEEELSKAKKLSKLREKQIVELLEVTLLSDFHMAQQYRSLALQSQEDTFNAKSLTDYINWLKKLKNFKHILPLYSDEIVSFVANHPFWADEKHYQKFNEASLVELFYKMLKYHWDALAGYRWFTGSYPTCVSLVRREMLEVHRPPRFIIASSELASLLRTTAEADDASVNDIQTFEV